MAHEIKREEGAAVGRLSAERRANRARRAKLAERGPGGGGRRRRVILAISVERVSAVSHL
jgi:hypothetical protein